MAHCPPSRTSAHFNNYCWGQGLPVNSTAPEWCAPAILSFHPLTRTASLPFPHHCWRQSHQSGLAALAWCAAHLHIILPTKSTFFCPLSHPGHPAHLHIIAGGKSHQAGARAPE
eukprot:1139574-Pelagomonas_calceolata.AAC.7